jgi:hypothetical protein
MIRSILQLSLIVLLTKQNVTAQTIEGYWLSGDSSRKYEINKNGNTYNCILASSTRKVDKEKIGAVVLRNITYNKRKNYYSGEIISLADGTSAFTKIYIDKVNPRNLNFKIYYFFRLYSVKIYWKTCTQ